MTVHTLVIEWLRWLTRGTAYRPARWRSVKTCGMRCLTSSEKLIFGVVREAGSTAARS